jgi:multiple sugar transport system ATP-binding protein
VVLRNVTKRYGDVLAVDDLSLEVRDHEFLVLVGPSGCGKTTVLRLIAGLEEPTSGEIYIGDRLVNKLRPWERDISMVFPSPDFALYSHMSVYDNIAFGPRVRRKLPPATESEEGSHTTGGDAGSPTRFSEGILRRRLEQAAARLGLDRYLNRRPPELSAGHRQTVALERAMVREPRVFLMDDPMSNLDAHLRAAARMELKKQHQQSGITTIYVTHDQTEAMTLGERVAVMKDGVLQQIGTPQALYRYPANTFVAGFIGSPPMNMFKVDVEAQRDGMFLKGRGFRVRVPPHIARRLSGREGESIIFGLRPEAIRDAQYAPDADPLTLVEGLVELREYLGSDILLHLRVGDDALIARVDSRTWVWPGQTCIVAFDMESMHAFDPRTERSLL